MEAKIYNQEGKEHGSISLPESVFGLPWNADLVHQVVVGMRSNERAGTAHAKDRGEVSGGGKKPWRQKGTGRSRHGSSRSPIWKGGGVTHGPLAAKDYSKKINKKMKAKALYVILSEKLRNGEVMFVEELKLSEIKTKKAQEVLASLSKVSGFERIDGKKTSKAYIAVANPTEIAEKSFQNIKNVDFSDVKNMNPLDLVNNKYLIISNPKESVEFISSKLS